MKSNRSGRFIQKIVINVAVADLYAISQRLPLNAETHSRIPLTNTLHWTRLTCHPGHDEDVIFDLWTELGDLAGKTEWHIDWEASQF